jgi:hypothetical protein
MIYLQASVGVRTSFTASLIEHQDRYRLSEREMAYLGASMLYVIPLSGLRENSRCVAVVLVLRLRRPH